MRTPSRPFNHLALFVTGCAVLILGGCNLYGSRQQATNVRSSITTVSTQLTQVPTALDALAEAITKLTGAEGKADLKPLLNEFRTQSSATTSAASRLNSAASNLEQKRRAYVQIWNEQLVQVQDDSIRKQSGKRLDAVQKHFASAQTALAPATAAVDKLSSTLKDLGRALDLDLSVNGVKALSSQLNSAKSQVAPAKTLAASAADALKELGDDLGTGATAPGAAAH